MNEIAILLKNVSKFYKLYDSPKERLREALNPFGRVLHRPFYALRNVDLKVKRGEILGVVGRNGSGKSTLLKVISSILQPSEGSVAVNGKISALLELGAGLNPKFTGIQNISFYGAILGYSNEEMEPRIKGIIEFADIGEFIHQPMKTYSSGMKARLGFALAVSVDPDILIVDEVLAVGDLLFRRKCYSKIQEFFAKGKTVILVSHSSQAIAQFCSRVVLLQDGELIVDGDPKTVLTYYEKSIFSRENNEPKKSIKEATGNKITLNVDPRVDSRLYAENLVTNPVHTNEDIAKIFDFRILNSADKIVNLLDRDETYTIEFKVRYLKPASQVALGAQIRTLKSLLVSGANQWDYQREQISQVDVKEILTAKWRFKCHLVPGVYVVAISSLSNSTGELVKLNDALIFKVRPSKSVVGGIVSLEQSISVEKLVDDM